MCIFLEQTPINFNQMTLLFTHPHFLKILGFTPLGSFTQPLNLSKLKYNWDKYRPASAMQYFWLQPSPYMTILLFLDFCLKRAQLKPAFNPQIFIL